jgi:tRNA 5-methylaminomethyl-2-thiouridine biosynthesis bifunctional protein
MVLPAVEGVCVVGASFDIDDDDPAPRAASDMGNLERLSRILSVPPVEMKGAAMQNRVGFRIVARDRLPLAGKVAQNLYCSLAFGSRGIIWSALAAEIIAAQLEGEPLPLEAKLAEAVDPLRFLARAKRREGSPA